MAALKYKLPFLDGLKHVTRHADETNGVSIENCIGFAQVPLGIAGPLRVEGPDNTSDIFYAPLATCEAALVASCSRGCKAFNQCGGIQFEILDEAMSRAPTFIFPSPKEAVSFSRLVPSLQPRFAEDAACTSRHVQLQTLTPHIIGSTVHVRFSFRCGDAAGQNMVTIATQACCDNFMMSPLARQLKVEKILSEAQLTSDKKPSWGNVMQTRGVQVICWGKLTTEVCQSVFRCTSEDLYRTLVIAKEGEIRNGQFGSNINASNIVVALFIACGQDAACAVDGSWSQLTPEYNYQTGELRLSMYFPSLPVGVIGGGTSYGTQKECLGILNCDGPGMKGRLAGLIAAFSLALDASTVAAITENTFSHAHERLRKRTGSRREFKE
ncbi:hypothetical protein EYZ11_007419 [Aspergillus tanneri]|uniref:hydroxymethylglutaryl-CoA reductase (NADPH) n=1 Tax=Aspergillus tanneri TaxID=1220188 RepID=A0A4S3JFA6_9EURO|nr:uncharacterized protein ATNIH1004_009299 [Aspergillus tanneri]KAA8645087.1 hypothetical protein ATNIH1004_009299 [Aspergillus tanneri]THC93107.1 hypothetical protein EYZ11_007419 [Aspergillus tanneri]